MWLCAGYVYLLVIMTVIMHNYKHLTLNQTLNLTSTYSVYILLLLIIVAQPMEWHWGKYTAAPIRRVRSCVGHQLGGGFINHKYHH